MRSKFAIILALGIAALLCCGIGDALAQTSDTNCLSLVAPGSVYIKPGSLLPIDMNVSNLQQEIAACQAFLNFSSSYFLTGPSDVSLAPGGGIWEELIWGVWNQTGDLDTAVGIRLDSPTGTSQDGAVLKMILKAKPNVEGSTTIVFRPDADLDPYLVDTTLLADTSGQPVWPTKFNSPVITIDGTAPMINILSAAENGASLVAGAKLTQGTLVLSMMAGDPIHGGVASGLVGPPTVTITLGDGTVQHGVLIGEDSPGVYNYSWQVTPTTPNGVATILATATDRAGNVSSNILTFEVNKNQIHGTVSMDTLRLNGSSHYSFDRMVTFKATNQYGVLLKTWLVNAHFVNAPDGIASSSYVLTDAPAGMTRLSAKTDWSLRRRQSVTLDVTGQASADFAGTYKLLGGDLTTDNLVSVADYNTLRANWFQTVDAADINGDGNVNTIDYNIMKSYWFMSGDPM